jgi:hypothetical protein
MPDINTPPIPFSYTGLQQRLVPNINFPVNSAGGLPFVYRTLGTLNDQPIQEQGKFPPNWTLGSSFSSFESFPSNNYRRVIAHQKARQWLMSIRNVTSLNLTLRDYGVIGGESFNEPSRLEIGLDGSSGVGSLWGFANSYGQMNYDFVPDGPVLNDPLWTPANRLDMMHRNSIDNDPLFLRFIERPQNEAYPVLMIPLVDAGSSAKGYMVLTVCLDEGDAEPHIAWQFCDYANYEQPKWFNKPGWSLANNEFTSGDFGDPGYTGAIQVGPSGDKIDLDLIFGPAQYTDPDNYVYTAVESFDIECTFWDL